MGRKKINNLKLMEIYNSSGREEAKRYLTEKHDIKYPRNVILRIKRDINNKYDQEQDKFLCVEESPFLELNELCEKSNSEPQIPLSESIINNEINNSLAIDDEIQQMLQSLAMEKLLAMTKYINLNQATRECLVNKNSLELAGYKVKIN